MTTEAPPAGDIRRGLAWSSLNSGLMRLGTFLTGIALARILAPEDFGVYAVALTAQTILINLSELGMTSYLVRHGDLDRRGPTLTTLSMASSSVMFAVMFFSAPFVSTFMGSSSATPVVQMLSIVLLFAGIGVVPAADMSRNFLQKKQFAVDGTNFVGTTGLTLALALAGMGPMSLALGRLFGQLMATTLQFALVQRRPRFGWDRSIVRGALAFGVPLAAANLLSWVLLTVDNAIVGHAMGAVALGLYTLAFNVSSWPMSVVGLAIRSVALPGFARTQDADGNARPDVVAHTSFMTALVVLPVGVLLAVLAGPLVNFLYGERWSAAASALGGLGIFGALRVVFDLWVAYIIARGATRAVLWIQALWIVALIPPMIIAVEMSGLTGAGWVHPIVALCVGMPAYLYVLRRHGVRIGRLLGLLVLATLPCIPTGLAAAWVVERFDSPFAALMWGGIAGSAAYLLCVGTAWYVYGNRTVAQHRASRPATSERTHLAARS